MKIVARFDIFSELSELLRSLCRIKFEKFPTTEGAEYTASAPRNIHFAGCKNSGDRGIRGTRLRGAHLFERVEQIAQRLNQFLPRYAALAELHA